MNQMTSLAGSIALAAAAILSSETAGAASARNFAGQWHIVLRASCTNRPDNRHACDQLLEMGVHVYGLKVTHMAYQSWDTVTVNTRNQFTEHGSAVVTGMSPGGVAMRFCNPSVMESRLFQGSCHITWAGTGHVAAGATIHPDFYVDAGVITFHTPQGPFTQRYSQVGDTLIPAIARSYTTHRYLHMVGTPVSMPGISIRLTVRHR